MSYTINKDTITKHQVLTYETDLKENNTRTLYTSRVHTKHEICGCKLLKKYT